MVTTKKMENMKLRVMMMIYPSLVLFVVNHSNILLSQNVNITSVRNVHLLIIRKVKDVMFVTNKRSVCLTLLKISLKKLKNRKRRRLRKVILITRFLKMMTMTIDWLLQYETEN